MSLNIKNEETHRLAAQLAELTGETMTTAVTLALKERLEREKAARKAKAKKRAATTADAPKRTPAMSAVGGMS